MSGENLKFKMLVRRHAKADADTPMIILLQLFRVDKILTAIAYAVAVLQAARQ